MVKYCSFHFLNEVNMMNHTLQQTVQTLMQSGTNSNPVLSKLISDYSNYHLVLVIVGGLFLLGLVWLNLFLWGRFKKGPKAETHKWTFEKKTYFHLGMFSVLVGLLMAFMVIVNASTVLEARQEFALAIATLKPAHASINRHERYQSFNTWLQSGTLQMPSLIQNKIDNRLAWQRPKAIVCSILLVGFMLFSARVWHTLIKRSHKMESERTSTSCFRSGNIPHLPVIDADGCCQCGGIFCTYRLHISFRLRARIQI
jgi:hypothetical protein